MPTRIKPDRIGYEGYTCVGILRPCIEPMTGTEFECLPKATRKLVTNVPYEDLTGLKDDPETISNIESCDEQFDPQNDGLRIDLWNAFRRNGLSHFINQSCVYPYIPNTNEPASEGDFPIDAESALQVVYDPGFMDPVVIPFPSIGDGAELDDEIPSSSEDSSGSSEGETDEFEHPFKARVKPEDAKTIQVGYLRPRWKDSILVNGPGDPTDDIYASVGQSTKLEFNTVEEITLNNTDYYIYYDIYMQSAPSTDPAVWVAKLEKSYTWPPPEGLPGALNDAYRVGNILQLIGYAAYDAILDGYVWYQHMYESPTVAPIDPRGQFEAWYIDDGYVQIDSGVVETFNGDSAVVNLSKAIFDLSLSQDIWVEIVVTGGEVTDVTITPDLQYGSYPGLYDPAGDCITYRFNYLIGSTNGTVYTPAHKGKLHIDNTLFQHITSMPNGFYIPCDALAPDSDKLRLMAFHESYHQYFVGDENNSQLYNGYSFLLEVRGGGIRSLEPIQEYKWYGLTEDLEEDLLDISGVDGVIDCNAEAGSGSGSILGKKIDRWWDYGIVQRFDINDADFGVDIEAGDNVWISYTAGAAAVPPGAATPASIKINSRGGADDAGPVIEKFQTVSGVPGSDFGLGSVTLQGRQLTRELCYGHVEQFDFANGDSLQIVAGANIKIGYVAGVATISAPDPGGSPCVEDSIKYSTTPCLHLDGDELNPTDWKFYGKSGGAKGWIQAELITVVTDVTLDASNILQITKRDCRVFDLQTGSTQPATGWAVTACP